MTYQIDKNVPMPKPNRSGRAPAYPWLEMEVGDSFLVEKLSISVTTVNKRYAPKRFASRKVEGGFRIWRVE